MLYNAAKINIVYIQSLKNFLKIFGFLMKLLQMRRLLNSNNYFRQSDFMCAHLQMVCVEHGFYPCLQSHRF